MTKQEWEQKFITWAKPPGTTEEDRCANAESMIRKAVAGSDKLKGKNIKIVRQGSYYNNTNVRMDSDVDIGVVCMNTLLNEYPENMSSEDFGLFPGTYHFAEFKNDVGLALRTYFGEDSVVRGNKAFDVKENSYRVEADVAPFFEHRRYRSNGSYNEGVKLLTDKGLGVINWPDQHYENGVGKNNATNRRYKQLVRILKNLRNEMEEAGIDATKEVPGFLVECLVWNVPNVQINDSDYFSSVRNSLAYLFNNTKSYEKCCEWGEVSELKYLFSKKQKWDRAQAHNFISAAWNYLELE